MKQRVITALILLALFILIIWQIATPLFVVVVAAFSAIAANEIMNCAKITNKFLLIVGTALGFIIPFVGDASTLEPFVSTQTWFSVINAVPKVVIITVLIIAYFAAMLKSYSHTKFEDVAITVVASLLVPSAFSMFVLLRDIRGYETNQLGVYLIFYALICSLVTDIGAQLGGMKFGKTKMSPNISPKKTIEGAACGIVFSLIINAIALVLYNKLGAVSLTMKQAAILLAAEPFIAAIGMMGDLSASVLKRNFNVKDFGKIFPGHGGVMDRFDASLFTVPLTYCIALYLV